MRAVLLALLVGLLAPAASFAVTIEGVSEDRYFSPDGDGNEDSASVSVTLSEKARVTVLIMDAGGQVVRHLATDSLREGSTGFSWDGRRDASTAVVPDGSYGYSIAVEAQSGDVATHSGRVGVDTSPVASFVRPDADATVSGVVDVGVRPAAARPFASVGYLYRCAFESRCTSSSLGYAGPAELDGTQSLSWDTAESPTGSQYLWASVSYSDDYGAAHSFPLPLHHVVVTRPPAIRDLSADRYFSPDGDLEEDAGTVSYSLTAAASVSVRIRDAQGAIVRRLVSGVAAAEGWQSFAWDGRDDDGALMPDGVYDFVIEAEGSEGAAATTSGRIGIDTAAVAAIVAPEQDAGVSGTVDVTVRPAPGRTLSEGGYLYRCSSEGRCVGGNLGWFGPEDLDGTRSLAWDTAESPTGTQHLWGYVSYRDAFDASHSFLLPQRRVTVTRPPQIRNLPQDRYFSPDDDGQDDLGSVTYSLSAPASVTVEIRDGGGSVVRHLLAGQVVAEGYQSFAWDGRDDAGAAVPDGAYAYTIEAIGDDGPAAGAGGRLGVDTQPVAQIDAPEAGAVVGGEVDVKIKPATGRTLTSGYAYRCYTASFCTSANLGWVGEADEDGRLGLRWNTAEAPTGRHYLWASVTYDDAFGAAHGYAISHREVTVSRAAAITNLGADRYFSPNGDEQEDTTAISYTVTAPASVTARVRNSEGELVRRLQTDESVGEGSQYVSWDGLDDDGQPAPDGAYSYTIEATSGEGVAVTTATASGRIGIDTQPVASFVRPESSALVSGEIDIKVQPAAGRSFTSAGAAYRCSYDARCVNASLGGFGPEDFDGARALSWDTAESPAGDQYLWASVTYDDAFGAGHGFSLSPRRVTVTRAVQISNVSADRYFSPDGDGREDDGGPNYCISTPADVRLTVRSGDAVVRTIETPSVAEGCHRVAWDGLDADGADAADGSYAYVLHAQGGEGDPATVNGRVGIRRAAPGAITAPAADDTLGRFASFAFEAGDVTVLSVRPCVASTCATVSAAGAAGRWASTLDLLGVASAPHTLTADIRWRDGYGTAHDTRLTRPVVVDLTAPEVELAATPAKGEEPLATKLRITAKGHDDETLRYSLDPGDGSSAVTGTIAPPYAAVEIDHAYEQIGTFKARVEVTDAKDRKAARSAYVLVTEPPNRPPVGSLRLDSTSGVAPLVVEANISATDPNDDELTYALSFGDGSPKQTGLLPHEPIKHTYTRAGSFRVRLAVSDGIQTAVENAAVVIGLPEPLAANAGDDQRVRTGETVTLDGSGSRPGELIDSYRWEFGDGTTGDGARTSHEYAMPGTYTARLTTRSGSESAVDTTKVTVDEPARTAGLAVHVTGGGTPLINATATVIGPDGTRRSATTDAGGTASLTELPDGDVAVYVYASGFRPRAVTATVHAGVGEVSADLEPGQLGAATLDSHRMTYQEILDAGIDVADPENSHVYEADIHLFVTPDEPVSDEHTIHVYVSENGVVCASDCGGGGSSGGGGGGGGGGGFAIGGYRYLPSVIYVEGQPVIQWLVLPMRASWLKEFFDVQLIVQNLTEGFSFSPGVADLQVPAGLTLAPTATPQTTTQEVPSIPGGQSRAVSWVLRGDAEGFYDLTAGYSTTLAPTGEPLYLQARTREPLHVWGASALKTSILIDRQAVRWAPYKVDIRVENVTGAADPGAGVPIYNMQIEMLDQRPDAPADQARFFYAPAPPQVQGTAEIAPGRSWEAHYTLFAGLGNDEVTRLRAVLERSFVQRAGGDVDLAPTIGFRDGPSAGPDAGPVFVRVDENDAGEDEAKLSWMRPADSVGYEIWTRQSLNGGTWTKYGDVPSSGGQESATIPARDRASGRYYAIGTKFADGRLEFRHQIGVGPARYVSLGDSFSAGEGVPAFEPGTASDVTPVGDNQKEQIPFDNKCHRSWQGSYGRLLTADQSVPANLEPARYAACSGAVTRDVDDPDSENPNPANAGEPAQMDRVNEFTDVISLSMGGNDIGFRDIALACIIADCSYVTEAYGAVGSNAWLDGFATLWTEGTWLYSQLDDVVDGPRACVNPVNLPAKLTCAYKLNKSWQALQEIDEHDLSRNVTPRNLHNGTLRTRLERVYAKLAARAPNARIYVQLYPQITDLKAHGSKCRLMGDDRIYLDGDERLAIAGLINQLNGVIRGAVESVNAGSGGSRFTVVPLGTEFEGHGLCRNGEPNPESYFNGIVNPYVSPSGDYGPIAYSFHPNARGQQAYARALAGEMKGNIANRVLTLHPRERSDAGTVFVPYGGRVLRATSSWHGSTVTMSLVSPSGETHGAGSPGVRGGGTSTSQWLEVDDPEPGNWQVSLFGDDVEQGGELVQVTAHAADAAPATAAAEIRSSAVAGAPDTFDLAAEGPAGATYQWTFSDGEIADGASVRHRFTNDGLRWAALRTNAAGEEAFSSIALGQAAADETPPHVGGVPSALRQEAEGPGGAIIRYTPPVAFDRVDGSVPVSCDHESGTRFELGSTTVTCTATDDAGNAAHAEFDVDIVDTTAPVIRDVPADVVAEATSTRGAAVTFERPVASDLVDGSPPVACEGGSGSVFPLGASTVICLAQDAAGNASQAAFKITVRDTTAPEIKVPAALVVEASSPGGAQVAYDASAADPNGELSDFSCSPRAGTTFALGRTTVMCSATDAQDNRASKSFEVTVRDTKGPALTALPEDIEASATSADGAVVAYSSPTASDAVDGPVGVRCAPASGSTFPLGVTAVACEAADSRANVGRGSFNVTVSDTHGPTIAGLPADVSVAAESPAGTNVSFAMPHASDDVDNVVSVMCDPASGSTFELGRTIVTCTASDQAGNATTAAFAVSVEDRDAPRISVPDDLTAEATGPAGARVTYDASAEDPIGALTAFACTPVSGATFALGLTAVTCSASDKAGNTATDSFDVRVKDTTAPKLEGVPGDIATEATSPDGAPVRYSTPRASDVVDGEVTVRCAPASRATFAVGTTRVTCQAVDRAGNQASAIFGVRVSSKAAAPQESPPGLPVQPSPTQPAAFAPVITAGRGMSSVGRAGSFALGTTIACPGDGPACTVRWTVKKGKRLGQGALIVRSGSRNKLRGKLSVAGRRLLRRGKRLRAKVTIAASRGSLINKMTVTVLFRAQTTRTK